MPIASSLVEYNSITRDSLLTSCCRSWRASVTRTAFSIVNLNVSCMSEILSLTACMKSSWPAIDEVTTLNWCHLYLSRILSIAAVWCSNDGANCSCRLLCDARCRLTEFSPVMCLQCRRKASHIILSDFKIPALSYKKFTARANR